MGELNKALKKYCAGVDLEGGDGIDRDPNFGQPGSRKDANGTESTSVKGGGKPHPAAAMSMPAAAKQHPAAAMSHGLVKPHPAAAMSFSPPPQRSRSREKHRD